jgi:hypothetical protein
MPGRHELSNTSFMTDMFPLRVTTGEALTAAAAEALALSAPRQLINRHRDGIDPTTVAAVRPHIANGARGRLRIVLGGPTSVDGTVGSVPSGAAVAVYALYATEWPALKGRAVMIGKRTATDDGLPTFLFDDVPGGCHVAVLCDKPATIFYSHTT